MSEIKKGIQTSDTRGMAILLESLDENSRILAKTYLSALADRARLDKAREKNECEMQAMKEILTGGTQKMVV